TDLIQSSHHCCSSSSSSLASPFIRYDDHSLGAVAKYFILVIVVSSSEAATHLHSMHHPRLASHINEMKSATSQLAKSDRVGCAHCCQLVRIGVLDLIEALRV